MPNATCVSRTCAFVFTAMTRNRTALDLFSAAGTELMVLLIVLLALGLSVSQYLSLGRERMRRVETKIRRRTTRRVA